MVSWVKVYNDQRINTHYILMALQTRKKKAMYLFQRSFYVFSVCLVGTVHNPFKFKTILNRYKKCSYYHG